MGTHTVPCLMGSSATLTAAHSAQPVFATDIALFTTVLYVQEDMSEDSTLNEGERSHLVTPHGGPADNELPTSTPGSACQVSVCTSLVG